MKPWGNSKERLAPFKNYKTDTLVIHGGQHPDPVTGAVMPPIFQTSTYAQKNPAEPIGEFEYSRTHNPTRRMLEDALALLEGGTYGLVMSSGMAAIHLVVTSLCKPGDEILCCDDVYGGTHRLLSKVLGPQGFQPKFVDLSAPKAQWESAFNDKTKMVWIETPTNPLLKLIPIAEIAKICKGRGIPLVVDNTFMSPIFQKPLDLGADVVIHSMTKYMNGHSDVVSGCIVTNRDDLAEKLYFNQNSIGAVAGPFDSWLVLRGIKTLAIRMRAHEKSAMHIAEWLEAHPKVEKVIYPGLKSHPQHGLAKEQMSGFGGMLSFYVKGGLKEATAVMKKTKLFTLAESLGGVESLIEHPALMTHASVPVDLRTKNGISDNFIRLSIGIEDVEDLTKDLSEALG